MAVPPRLAELQARFWRLITAPEPVGKVLPEIAAGDPEIAPLGGWIAAGSEAAAIERLDVYANMYFFRLLDVLREDFPNLVKLVGDDAFHNLVTAYLLAHPSDNPSLRWLGRRFPDHLDGDAELRRRHPAAPALARLEWLRGEAFDAEDAPVATMASLAAATPEAFSAMRLAMQPALRIILLDHRVLPLWLALERGEERPEPAREPARVVIWRRGFRVYHRAASADEVDALRVAISGGTFADMCESLWPHAGEQTPALAVNHLRTWIEQETVASVLLPP